MDFKNVDKKWLNEWNDIYITKDAFITRHSFANICVKDVGIEPDFCAKKMEKQCSNCWEYVYSGMCKRQMFKAKKNRI